MFKSRSTLVSVIVLVIIAGVGYGVFRSYLSFIARDGAGGYRYVKWEITEKRGIGGKCIESSCIQAAQFILMHSGQPVAWLTGSVAMNPAGSNPSGEVPGNILDGSMDTKWVDLNYNKKDPNVRTGKSTLVMDIGQGNRIAFDGYRWATANDEPDRDPVSWQVYGSNNAKSWTLLDTRTNVSVPDARSTYTENYVLGVGQ